MSRHPRAASPAVRGRRGAPAVNPLRRQRLIWGPVFALPAVALVTIQLIVPTIQGIYYSFTDWNGRRANWIGLDNYINGVFRSADFPRIAFNSLVMILTAPVCVAIALLVAHVLATMKRGSSIFRAIYFFPISLSWVIMGVAFGYILSGRGGFNSLLSAVGLSGLTSDWLGNESTALIAVLVVFVWAYLGINIVLLYTGMTTIDPSILEAATLDGASGTRLVISVVVPQVRRYIELCIIITISAALTQIFGLIYTMTAGGPGVATTTLEYALYTSAYQYGNFGRGAAFGILLFLVTCVFAITRLRSGLRADDE